MKIFVFGSSLTSTYWNGAATYYRGIYKNLHRLGHTITFAEPDIYKRQQNRDAGTISYAEVCVYRPHNDIPVLLRHAANCDLVIKHSGVGAEDETLEREVIACRSSRTKVIFWDVDAPATLARVESDLNDPFRKLIPKYDLILTYGGGQAVVDCYRTFGAKACVPVYNALDPDTHFPVEPDPALSCDLAFVGHRLPDRESRIEEFFLRTALSAPEMSFLLGGEGWGEKPLPRNVRWIGHVGTEKHNLVNSSARMVLNVNRESMAKIGFSPPTRVFEAAGAAACVITDAWEGIEKFFTPGAEILPATSSEQVVTYLRQVGETEARSIGTAMLSRALRDHTYELRTTEVHAVLQNLSNQPISEDSQLNGQSVQSTLCS